MKVRVKADGKNINVRFPSSLLYSSLTINLIRREIKKKSGIEIDKETSKKIQKIAKKAIKQFKGLTLVEVQSAEGEIVEIIL